MKRGLFITLEGPEGCGKSTHIRRLAERLIGAGVPVLLTREPGGTPTGEAIRRLLQHDCDDAAMAARTEVLLFCASRAQLVKQVIAPALARGTWVLSDRFADSTLAYQGYGRGFAQAPLRALNAFATGGLAPDLTLLLDIGVAAGLRRVGTRHARDGGSMDRIERATRAFHERVRAGFLKLAQAAPQRFVVCRTNRPPLVVGDEIWQAVCERCLAAPPGKGIPCARTRRSN